MNTPAWQLSVLPRMPQCWRPAPHRMATLFGKVRPVYGNHPVRVVDHGSQSLLIQAQHLWFVPGGTLEEELHRAYRLFPLVAQGNGLDGLAVQIAQQIFDKGFTVLTLFTALITFLKICQVFIQCRAKLFYRLGIHTDYGQKVWTPVRFMQHQVKHPFCHLLPNPLGYCSAGSLVYPPFFKLRCSTYY